MKVVHIADIHWRGLSRHDEYKESFSCFFDKISSMNPDIIYVGGDIVHSKTQGISPELIDSLCWWFTEMSNIAPTHVILGNHDGLVLNKSRQDAITPIIDALDNPNIYLYKDSGVYPTGHDGFEWCVFSCFDEENWKNVKPSKDNISLALFHGAAWGSTTDIDWSIEGDITVDFFDGYDFALLGDIHKQQFLNDKKTIAYCGSTIQQNYGEDTGKGFLFWDIRSKDDFDVEFFEIPHFKPFVTIEWKGSVKETVRESLKYPNDSRFRIKSNTVITQLECKQLQVELKKLKDASEVVFKSESSFDVSKIKTADGLISKENLRDVSTHKKLIREYYRDSNIAEDTFKNLEKLSEKYMSQITDERDILRNCNWQINSLKFDNLFAYGCDNFINFENLPGITGIFGKNTRGKSSIIGSLMYGLFNTTDRGSIKNEYIINSRKQNCSATVELAINADLFNVSRSTVKHHTRKGETYASTSLQVHKIDKKGKIKEDLTEEQRRETEKILKRLIGTSEDFLMTSLASQGEMNTFIKEGATERKRILTKFLDLGVFEKMYDMAKSGSSDLRSKARAYPEIDWDEEIDNIEYSIMESKKKISNVEREIKEKRDIQKNLNIDLAVSDNPDVITLSEIKSQQKIVASIESEISKLEEKNSNLSMQIEEIQEKKLKIDLVKSDFSIETLREKLSIQKNLESTLVEIKHICEKNERELARQKKSIKKLEKVPCGDKFASCMFIKDSHKDKSTIQNQEEIVKDTKSLIKGTEKSLRDIMSERIEEKIDMYAELLNRQSELSVKISSLSVEANNIKNEISQHRTRHIAESAKLKDMSSRVVEGEENPASVIRSRILETEAVISSLDRKRMSLVEKIAALKHQMSSMKKNRKEFEEIRKDLKEYDLFMQAVSKKGIPLQIMMEQLPLINSEISKILQGVTGFTVELEADIDSNSMDIFINYGDSKRIIELASGMEKMMSSLAIRVALINVSSLTKTNMLIIDEGFGALDANNIEACSRLLQSLKKWFRNIIVISHVDAIKDAVDNSLEIIKNEKDTKIYSQ